MKLARIARSDATCLRYISSRFFAALQAGVSWVIILRICVSVDVMNLYRDDMGTVAAQFSCRVAQPIVARVEAGDIGLRAFEILQSVSRCRDGQGKVKSW
ncbi:hypothetical protein [Sphingomonas palmae]|uniref:hypothetical protein n=1 Tax=Sphingomonas palmae TaxID=1855283 RepID=UPI00115FAB9B|nr:hypothetical protein [Sphingomonas palmae]